MSLAPATALLRWWSHQRLLPFGLRDRLLRLAADPDRMAPHPFTCDFFGQTYVGDLSSFIDWTIYFYGAYERGVLAFLRDAAALAGPDAVFFDVGANVGQHSLFLAPRVARVHAFEPWDQARIRLERNLAVNNVANVVLHPFGLGDASGEHPFFIPASANLGTGSFVPDVNANATGARLPVRRGDEVVAALAIDRVDVIKIDTEGFEVKVLAGLAGTLARDRPVVVFELSETTWAELAADGSARAGLRRLLPPDWQVFSLGHHPERYCLTPYDDSAAVVNLVAAPPEKASRLPRRGA